MINNKTVLAVIPARGGSKRTVLKNIREFRDKPLLYWSIEAARHSKHIDRFVVSTESTSVKLIALGNHAQVIDRPEVLATDTATNEDVLRHANLTFDPPYDWLVLLQPTSPLRTAQDIDRCIEIAARNGQGCVSYRQRNGTKNGAVYVASREWLAVNDFTTPLPGVHLMADEVSADFDYPEEWALYE